MSIIASMNALKTTLQAIAVGTVASVATKRSLQRLAIEITAQCVSLETMTRPSLTEIHDLKVAIKDRFQILKVDNAFWGFWGTGKTVARMEEAIARLEQNLQRTYETKKPEISFGSKAQRVIPELIGYIDNPDSIGSYFTSGTSESFPSTEGDAADAARLLELLT